MAKIKLSVVPKRGVEGVAIVTAQNSSFSEDETLKIVLERVEHAEPFLGDKGWQSAESNHTLHRIIKTEKGLVFELGPQIVQFMSTGSYRVKLYSANSTDIDEGVLAWQRIPNYRPRSDRSGAIETVEKNSRPMGSSKPSLKKVDSRHNGREDQKDSQSEDIDNRSTGGSANGSKGKALAVVLGAFIVLVAVSGGWYFFMVPDTSEVASVPSELSLNEQLTAFLAGNPTADEIFAKGEEFLVAEETGAAMSLFRRAGEAGNAEAYFALAKLYDPTSDEVGQGPRKNGAKAYSYYVKAKQFDATRTAQGIENLKNWAEEQAADGDEQAQQLVQIMSIGN